MKRYKCGLVVGKFSPLHKGHEYLIESAFKQCEKVVVISYSRPEFSSCSANKRRQWIHSLFPSAIILCVDAAQVEGWCANSAWQLNMPWNDDTDVLHRKFTFSLLSQKIKCPVDAVFTSEGYGDGFANFLSDPNTGFGQPVEHVCIDLDRKRYPISGSSLRSAINSNSQLIDDAINDGFRIQRICFLGGESTGKSTLAKRLSEKFNEPLISEYGRDLWDLKNGELSELDLIDICKVQTRREDDALIMAKQFIFCDTSPLTTLCYSQALFKRRCKIVQTYAERPYHYMFLCEPDFKFVQDGTRQNGAFRLWQHKWYVNELTKTGIEYLSLTGSIENRISQVCAKISAPS